MNQHPVVVRIGIRRVARALRVAGLYALRACGAFRLAQYLTRSRLRILCYHGFAIGDEADLLPLMFMRATTFERRMSLIAQRGLRVVTLDRAVELLRSSQVSRAETVITLDDGWATTLSVGVPILQRYGFPASVYVTTQHLGSDCRVFNVALNYMIRKTARRALRLAEVHPALDGVYDLSEPAKVLAQLTETARAALSGRQRG